MSFYEKKLGFAPVAKGPGFALLSRNSVLLQLWLADDRRWKERTNIDPIISGAESFLAGTASCRIEVTEIETLHAACREHDIVHPNGPLKRADYGALEFAVLDHEGNLITFFQPV
ncbi:VOC family protein [Minwuia sp. IMCC3060]|uniref:VOC family protein n=1 Tax=Minwuia sp. IMCC3060 TaxID=3040675 RepID=UPI0032B058B3